MPSAKLHQCVQDVMAQGHDEDSAYAICQSTIGEMRHRDFQRIHDEFCNYYKDPEKGEREYRDWLNALHLNDTVEYGRAQESFKWAKDMLSLIREDADNKYYQVIVGFPIKSMNGNVYKERDLIAAALTLKGTHPSLNHKDEYWFSPTNPHNRWGTLTTEAAKYEDGAIEAILKVPKDAICPICNGAKMTELIDSKRIVNVSLEGGCSTERYGECEGFTFNEKGFTLLTTDILPGIPMARIFPLEHIMVEALQSSTKQPKGEKRMKIKAIVKESGTQDTTTTVYDNPMSGTNEGPSGKGFKGTLTDVSQQTNVAVGADPAQSKPEGIWQTMQKDQGKPVPHERVKRWKEQEDDQQCEADFHWDAEQSKCVPDEVAQKEGKTGTPGVGPESEVIEPQDEMPGPDSHVGPDKSSTPPTHLDMPEGDTSMHPTEPSKLKPGVEPPYADTPFPHPSLEERVARIRAELKAKSSEEQSLLWQQKHNEVYEQLRTLEGSYIGLNQAFDKLNERSLRAEGARKEAELKYNQQCGLVTDLKHQLNETNREVNDVTEKYNKLLRTSLELNQKWTKADEDYLDMAKKVELLEDKLSQARKEAKRIVRIKA